MAAARALGVIRVNRPALERGDRVVDVARLVQRVGVDRDLHVVLLGDRQAAVDRRRRRAPVLVQLEADRAGADLLDEALRAASVLPLPSEAEVERQRVGRLQHQLDVPRAGRAGRRVGAGRRAGAAADERRDAAGERLVRPAAGR